MVIMLPSVIIFQSACNASKRTKGAIIGAATGAATGAIVGKDNRAVGIILGAAVGGVAGGLIGEYMDRQAAEIQKDLEGATVERVGEGILVTFDSGLLFDFDSYQLRPETIENLNRLASTLQKYDKTDVKILGHTDNVGTENYNSELSENRADAVENYLINMDVTPKRLDPVGLGENDPIASNETEIGRQKNRRVEVTIVASKKLIRDARKGDLPEA